MALLGYVHSPVRKPSTGLRHSVSLFGKTTNFYFYSTEQVTIYFLKDLMSGAKKSIFGPDVRHVSIPQYEGLGLKEIGEFVSSKANVLMYLPDGKEIHKVPK